MEAIGSQALGAKGLKIFRICWTTGRSMLNYTHKSLTEEDQAMGFDTGGLIEGGEPFESTEQSKNNDTVNEQKKLIVLPGPEFMSEQKWFSLWGFPEKAEILRREYIKKTPTGQLFTVYFQ